MDARDALELIADAVPDGGGGLWADMGAGEGVFTRALASRIGPTGTVYAVERDRRALAALERAVVRDGARVIPVVADFTADFELPRLGGGKLNGVLFANSLHFVRDAVSVLSRMVALLATSGRVVVVEYAQHEASRWVPYPVPPARLDELSGAAGLSPPAFTTTRPSAFGGSLYAAVALIRQ